MRHTNLIKCINTHCIYVLLNIKKDMENCSPCPFFVLIECINPVSFSIFRHFTCLEFGEVERKESVPYLVRIYDVIFVHDFKNHVFPIRNSFIYVFIKLLFVYGFVPSKTVGFPYLLLYFMEVLMRVLGIPSVLTDVYAQKEYLYF